MAPRLAQIAIVLAAFGVLFAALFLAAVPPRPLLIGLAIPASILCLVIAIRPITRESWESFWESLARYFPWF